MTHSGYCICLVPIGLGLNSVARPLIAQELIGLGDLPGGVYLSEAYDVSGDGSTVVGWSHSESGWQAFRWRAETGMVGLGDLPGGNFISVAYGVSDDGSVVVGTGHVAVPAISTEAFQWTEETGMVGLGFLPHDTPQSQAFCISGDGSVIGGRSRSDLIGQNVAVLWTPQGGIQDLGVLPSGRPTHEVWGLSEDGSIAIGHAQWVISPFGPPEAFVWNQSQGLVAPGFLPGGVSSSLSVLSQDGSIAYGTGTSSQGYEVLQWTREGGLQGWGVADSYIHGGATDIPVLVGENTAESEWRATIWDPEHGGRLLEDFLLEEYGFDLGGWVLRRAYGISADGRTIVGHGSNPDSELEAWLIRLPNPSPAAIPAVSGSGTAVMMLLVLTAGWIVYHRRSTARSTGA